MPLNWELRHKDKPADSREDSTLTFEAKGPRHKIRQIVEAIQDAIAKKEDN
jgi:hypothetical protein